MGLYFVEKEIKKERNEVLNCKKNTELQGGRRNKKGIKDIRKKHESSLIYVIIRVYDTEC